LGPLGSFEPLARFPFFDLTRLDLRLRFMVVATSFPEVVSIAGIGAKIGVYRKK
jgi:hypothetical protein